jgi:hypothetical protein
MGLGEIGYAEAQRRLKKNVAELAQVAGVIETLRAEIKKLQASNEELRGMADGMPKR